MSFFDAYMRMYAMMGLPAMTSYERKVYKNLLQNFKSKGKVRIFEYGSGFSTVYFARHLKDAGADFEFHSVDNNEFWHQRVKVMVKKAGLSSHVHLHLSVFEPFWTKPGWSWEKPVACGQFAPKSAAEEAYINMPKTAGGNFQLIVLDGRFRRRCLDVAKSVLAPNGVILLHDAQKTHYHPPANLVAHGQWIEGGKFYPWQKFSHKMWLGSHSQLPAVS